MTRKKNELLGLLENTTDVNLVRTKIRELNICVDSFLKACEVYEEDLSGDEELEELRQWRQQQEDKCLEAASKAEEWCRTTNKEPEDVSVVTVESRKSNHSDSVASVSESVKILACARKAELQAEKDFLERQFDLQQEEIALNRRKEMLEVEKSIAKENAKIQAVEDYEGNSDGKKSTEKTVSKSSSSNRSSSGEDCMKAILQQQTIATELLLKQQQRVLLPRREVPTYNGEPTQYKLFVNAFDHLIAEKTDSDRDRLYYLDQYTTGRPQELVRSCLHMEPKKGYQRAREMLEEKFGDKYKITESYISKLMDWPVIKSEQSEELESLSIYMISCANMMEDVSQMSSLDHVDNLQKIVAKLPYELRKKWRGVSVHVKRRKDRIANFKDLTEFISEEAEVMQDPIFGKISDTTSASKLERKEKSKPKSLKYNSKSLVTSTSKEDSSSKSAACVYCQKGNHNLNTCFALKKLSYSEKMEALKKKSVCFGCLKIGHRSRDCRARMKCDQCNMNHPSILHQSVDQKKDEDKTAQQPEVPGPSTKVVNSCSVESNRSGSHIGAGEVFVAIVPVKIKLKGSDNSVITYAAQDPYSTAAFISEKLVRSLGAKGLDTKISLTTMEKKNSTLKTKLVSDLEICDLDENNIVYLRAAYMKTELPVTTEDLVSQEKLERWSHLKEIPIRYVDAEVGILLGVNTPDAVKPLEIVDGNPDEPYAIRTKLGWAVNGPSHPSAFGNSKKNYCIKTNAEIQEMITMMYNENFMDKEDIEEKGMSIEDRKWLTIVQDNTKKIGGHYEIPLPFKKPDLELPNNYPMALYRANSLKRKLCKDNKLFNDYKLCIDNLVKSKFVSRVDPNIPTEKGRIWYVPHHGVYHPKKPEKVRIVFDCSAQYKNSSLNKSLLQGPDLTNSLIGVLLRFRQEEVAFMADVESMFHQVRVPEKERDFLRFLWWPEGNLEADLEEYRLNVHLFGAVSSPSCANYALKRTADDNMEFYDEEVISTVHRNFYVDDCLRSVATEEKAIHMVKSLKELASKGGFNLTKFISSSRAVNSSIPEIDRAKVLKSLDLSNDKMPIERALGVEWCAEADAFQFNINIKQRTITRRSILSVISSIYDPMGLIGPLILPARGILQELTRLKLDWDDPVPKELEESWCEWIDGLQWLSEFKVSRCIKPKDFGMIKRTELHHFSDASHRGYGVASYVRLIDVEGRIHSSFVFGKSRCAPLKTVTIPRLELTAATLSIRADKLLRKELDMKIDDSYFWTDSTTVLKYIRNESRRFLIFVANRVQFIHEGSKTYQWRHVDTKSNPGDLASRGTEAELFVQNPLWLCGPQFLCQEEREWPNQLVDSTLSADDVEVRREKISMATSLPKDDHPITALINRVSSWTKLVRVMALVMKAKRRFMKPHETKWKSTIAVEDLVAAELSIVQSVQNCELAEEMDSLKDSKPVKRSSPIYKLDPFVRDGIIRVGGRMKNSELPYDAKHPVLIPKTSPIAKMIIRHHHNKVGHLGRESVLASVRESFWIIGASSIVRQELRSCLSCRKRWAKVGEQKMSDLPLDRVKTDIPPFTNVGVDYFGPFMVKRGRTQEKRYGCLFTCLNIRAVHIEVTESLRTDSFVNALRRFTARRGQVQLMRSDNGTNFKSADKELGEAIAEWNESHIVDYLAQKKIKWLYNPPGASHHGGVWERMIRTVRNILKSIAGEQLLTDEQLRTVMCEAEGIINGRPLTKLSDDPNDLEVLTPNHLLLLKSGPSIPPGLFSSTDVYSRRRWRQIQYIADTFWIRWRKEYLCTLQGRQKWNSERRNLRKGDLVFVMDETIPRSNWKLGLVISTTVDKNGLVRSAEVKTENSVYSRPISKLCLLKCVEELEV